MSFAVIEDQHKRAEIILFPKIHEKFFHIIEKKSAILVCGDSTESSSDVLKIKVSHIIDLQKFSVDEIKEFTIIITEEIQIQIIKEELSKLAMGMQIIKCTIKENNTLFSHVFHQKKIMTLDFIDYLYKKNISIVCK